MGGVDTVRGINYQHCHALLAALDVAADQAFAAIRVEGTDDVLDLEIHAESQTSGAGTVVVRGLQMKSRMQPYTWAKSELLAIVRRWAGRPVSATSEFALLTDGELSPTGRDVAAALEAARGGDMGPIAAFLDVSVGDPLCAVAAKVTIVSEPGTAEALLLSAEREVRARLLSGPCHPDAEKEAEDRVNELFVLISKRSGLPDPDQRIISRAEILNVLGGVSQLSAADRWAESLGAEYVSEAAAEKVDSVVVPSLRSGWNEETLTIGDITATVGPILLSGRTGSGKSTVARLWRLSAAAAGDPLVVCQAEAYLPQRLDRAVADAVSAVVGRDLPRAVGGQVLGDPATTVVIDGVSEVPSQIRSELARELRNHLAGGHGARVVLIGRDESVCASTLPATQASTRLYPQAFGHGERLELTAKVLRGSGSAREPDLLARTSGLEGTMTGQSGELPTHECRVALAQVEHALGDAAGNPMLLRLALELVAGGTTFTDRASVYELTVERMAARTNVADIRIASAALGIVFARLLDEGRRYANPLEWARLLKEAEAALEALGVVSARGEVGQAVVRSGLVNVVVTAIGQTGLRVPVHDSFADYFAARAHADGLVSLPGRLVDNDENRVLLSAQMGMLSNVDCLAVAAQLPFTLVRLSESDDRAVSAETPGFVAALLNAVLPDSEPVGVTMWRADGRAVAQVGAAGTLWVEPAKAPSLFAGPTVVAESADGPVTIAVRLWRLILKQRLSLKSRLRPRSPHSSEEARGQLVAHSEETIAMAERLIAQVAPPVAAERLSRMAGPHGMTGVVLQRQSRELLTDGWPVRYRQTPDINLLAALDDKMLADSVSEEHMHSGDVDSLLSSSPGQTAAKRITEAINKLTRNHWL